MQDDFEDDNIERILEVLEELYEEFMENFEAKFFIKIKKRGAYIVESERFSRFFQYRCGHKDARNFTIYTVVRGEEYLTVYCTQDQGDRMCVACAIKSLDQEKRAA
ncbi:MAG: hypothetical protein KC585_00310 [Candidatus Magasanikbacteria bacterium]|nr:hypothetical protein [Candidatus Magasanikbacteria bacterium]